MAPKRPRTAVLGDGRSVELASLRDRFSAAVIDALIEFAAFAMLTIVLVSVRGDDDTAPLIVYLMSLLAVHYVLPAYWSSREGHDTPGKRHKGLRVIGIDGKRISFGRGLLRIFILDLAGLLNVVRAAVDRRSQGLHDKAARTLVVRLQPSQTEPPNPALLAPTERALPGTSCPNCGFALMTDGSCRVCGGGVRTAT